MAHPQYGLCVDAKLLSGIVGHSLCLNTFGPPSDEELSHGISVHGEASVATRYGDFGDGQLCLSSGSTPLDAASHACHTRR